MRKTNGVVTLAGKARTAAEKDLATKLVEDDHGASVLVNNMTFEVDKKE